jgi:hypothetical protein
MAAASEHTAATAQRIRQDGEDSSKVVVSQSANGLPPSAGAAVSAVAMVPATRVMVTSRRRRVPVARRLPVDLGPFGPDLRHQPVGRRCQPAQAFSALQASEVCLSRSGRWWRD